MRRNWIKIYVDQCLRGTMISELSASERWAWIGLLLMAGDSNEDGKVFLRKDTSGKLVGFSEATISELLGLEISEFRSGKKKMIKFNKIMIDKNNVIKIVNWKKYQSEYQRQRPYRDDESDEKSSNSSCNSSNALDRDRDIDIDLEEEKTKTFTQTKAHTNITMEEQDEISSLLADVVNIGEKKVGSLLGFLKELSLEYPDVDYVEEIKKKCSWWKDHPIKASSNLHLQIRNWFSIANKFQKELNVERKVGESTRIPLKEEDGHSKARAVKMKQIQEKYQPEIDKAMKAHASDWLDEIDNKIKEEIAEFSRKH